MFTVVVTEKGGAERRELFEKEEISVGRVQGNDLLLPKGNVSKRHARLIFKEGRVFVADLKSTNGTYVNGRKILQATVIRDGDKIYVGDFVLRVETGAPSTSSQQTYQPGNSFVGSTFFPPSASIAPPGFSEEPSSVSSYAERTPPGTQPPAVASPSPSSPSLSERRAPETIAMTDRPSQPVDAPAVAPLLMPRIGPSYLPQVPPSRASESFPPQPVIPAVSSSRTRPPPSSRDAVTSFPHRQARQRLVQEACTGMNLSELDDGTEPSPPLVQRVELTIAETIRRLQACGEVAQELSASRLLAEVRAELLDIGPLQGPLQDPDVTEIQVQGESFIFLGRGDQFLASELSFSSARTLRWALLRLCRRSHRPLQPDERTVERRLDNGDSLRAILAPLSSDGDIVLLRKSRPVESSLDDLVRSGTISRAIASFLQQCISARANVLITGTPPAAASSVVAGLLSSFPAEDRVAAVQQSAEFSAPFAAYLSFCLPDLEAEGGRLLRAAASLRPDRMVVSPFTREIAAETLAAVSDGAQGVLALARAPSLARALERAVPDLVMARPGLTASSAREWIAASFDLGIEVAQLRDGRRRVLRVAEILGVERDIIATRDLYTFLVERTAAGGSLEGTFSASGHVARISEELAARGFALDSALFKRPTR